MSLPAPTGILLFAFIPLVLVLYLRMPLGPAWSIGLGFLLMLGHRFVARPWMRRNVSGRCFWCASTLEANAVDAPLRSRGEEIPFRACCHEHAKAIEAFGRSVSAALPLLVLLILLPVGLYLFNALLHILALPHVELGTAIWFFKIPVALAVVSLSLLYGLGSRLQRNAAVDLPVHNLFLLGIRNTLWVFRLVGLWWLADGAWRLVS